MVSKSIVGRFLILAVLLVSLGVIAQAAIIITQGSSKRIAKRDGSTSVAAASLAEPQASAAATPAAPNAAPAPATALAPSADSNPVRVVYPGPLGDMPIQPRKITASVATSPTDAPAQAPVPQPVVPAPSASAVPQATAAPAVATAEPTPLDAVKPAPTPTVEASAEPDTAPPASAAATGHGVNLNNATVAQLNSMGAGHIGQAIVQHRPYHSVEDLMKKRVIRRSIFDQIKNQVAAE